MRVSHATSTGRPSAAHCRSMQDQRHCLQRRPSAAVQRQLAAPRLCCRPLLNAAALPKQTELQPERPAATVQPEEQVVMPEEQAVMPEQQPEEQAAKSEQLPEEQAVDPEQQPEEQAAKSEQQQDEQAVNPEQQPEEQAEASEQQQLERLWREIQLLAMKADELEASGRYDESAELLSAAIARIQSRGHADLDVVPLRQLLWDLLHAAGRYEDALTQAKAVHEAVAAAYSPESAEAHLVAVRLGISSAACGQPGPALRLIHAAVKVLEHNLGGMLEQGQEMADAAAAEGASEEDRQQLNVMQQAIDKVASAMGEGNFYGGLITMHFATQEGAQQGVVNGWEELETLVIHGFCGIMAAQSAVQAGHMLQAALRDHDGLTEVLKDDPLLGRLIQKQNERVHEAAQLGLDHPLLQ